MANFILKCEECGREVTFRDGYTNDEDIKLTVSGENLVYVKCECYNEAFVFDGDI